MLTLTMHIHKLNGYIQHIYLAEHAQGLVLLDGCSRADVSMLCHYIEQDLGRPLSDLKVIVVTHMHPDHAGGAHVLRRLTGALIAAHPKARRWYAGVLGRTAHLIDVGLTWWVAKRLGKPRKHIWYNPLLNPDVILLDEQPLPFFADWQVIFTPGHTDHDLSLFHRPSGCIYVADLIVQVKRRLVPPYPVCHPNQYKQSLRRVQHLGASRLLCAHVPEMQVADLDFDAIIQQAPLLPKNHWHSTRNRIFHAFGWQSEAH